MAKIIPPSDLEMTPKAVSAESERPELSLKELETCSAELLAQALAQKLAIPGHDWHRLNRDRTVRAKEQTAAALVYLLKGHPEEAIPRLSQAIGWLDKTLTAPPCPTHGEKRAAAKKSL